MIALIGLSGTWEWVIILVIILIFFGVGKLPNVLGQMGKGVKAFKDGMKDDAEDDGAAPRRIAEKASDAVEVEAEKVERPQDR